MAYFFDPAHTRAMSSSGSEVDSTPTSKEVFTLRKVGKLKDAWIIACQFIAQPQADDWDLRAYGYCLIDLNKQESVATQCGLTKNDLAHLAQELIGRMPELFATTTQGHGYTPQQDGPDAYFVSRIRQIAQHDPNSPEAPSAQQVFALRKEGKLKEAFALASHLMTQPQVSEWDLRAMGYCLISLYYKPDVAAQCGLTYQDLAQMATQVIDKMPQVFGPSSWQQASEPRPKNDYKATFVWDLCHIVSSGRANRDELTKAIQADKDKDYASAVQHYLAAARLDVLTAQEELSFAWALYHHSKILLSQAKRNFVPITNNLGYYLNLQHIAKPSLVNSCMLVIADQITDERFHYAEFLQAFDPNTLAAADFQPQKGTTPNRNGHIPIYEALWQRVLRHMSKNTLQRLFTSDRPNEATLDFVLQLCRKQNQAIMDALETGSINLNAPEHKNKIWLFLYEAKLHQQRGDFKQGLDLALTLLRRKASEYWAWQLMGRLELKQDNDAALTCLCKAQTLNPPFSPRHHVELATLLKDMGQEQWAASELYYLEQVCSCTGIDLPAAGQQQLKQAWVAAYKDHKLSVSELQQLYQQYAANANDLQGLRLRILLLQHVLVAVPRKGC